MNPTVFRRTALFFPILLCVFFLNCQAQESPEKTPLNHEIDALIQDVQLQTGMPGIALAVVKNGKVIHKGNYGYVNLEHEVPVSDKSIFPLYSLTKPFISVGVFHLIEQGKIKLNDPVIKYIDYIPKEWKAVKIKHLLSHSSGLPDMRAENPYVNRDHTNEQAQARVFALPIQFKPGERYDYNQTNFWLLKEIIEKVSERDLSDFILEHQFGAKEPEGALFSHDARDIIKHRATAYFPWLKDGLAIDLNYTKGDYYLASNGFHLSLNNFIEWDKKLRENTMISKASKTEMWKLFPYADSDKKFCYAWEATELQGHKAYGFSGSMVTFYRVYPEADMSIIFLANGFSQMYNQDSLADGIAEFLFDSGY